MNAVQKNPLMILGCHHPAPKAEELVEERHLVYNKQ